MPIRREEIEALPGFLRWSSFGEGEPGAGPPAARIYSNGDVGCAFASELAPHEAKLVFDYLMSVGPKDDSYLWDGSQKGWKLVSDADDVRVAIRFGRPLEELSASRLDVLRNVLEESTFNHLSAFQTETMIWFRGRPDDPKQARDALNGSGFEAEILEGSYHITRELNGQSQGLIIEDEQQHERVVKRMLEAGVPVEHRPMGRG